MYVIPGGAICKIIEDGTKMDTVENNSEDKTEEE
jgi:hypothetical protein